MSSTASISPSSQFRKLFLSEQLEFICEAHNGLSAKIVQEAGFRGIWASGLSISAQFGVRDNNEASWTQVLENLEFMSDATKIPILLDAPCRKLRELSRRTNTSFSIEDKVVPVSEIFPSAKCRGIAGRRRPSCSALANCYRRITAYPLVLYQG